MVTTSKVLSRFLRYFSNIHNNLMMMKVASHFTTQECGSDVPGSTVERLNPHLADPGAQQADADLPIVIQVGVEAPAALGQVAEQRGHGRVDVGQLDVKQEEPVLVGRACRALDQRREQVLVDEEPRSLEVPGLTFPEVTGLR